MCGKVENNFCIKKMKTYFHKMHSQSKNGNYKCTRRFQKSGNESCSSQRHVFYIWNETRMYIYITVSNWSLLTAPMSAYIILQLTFCRRCLANMCVPKAGNRKSILDFISLTKYCILLLYSFSARKVYKCILFIHIT